MNAAPAPHRTAPRAQHPWVGWFVGPVFLVLALWFVFGPSGLDQPLTESVGFDHAALSIEPRRTTLSDPPTLNIDGFDRTCMSCHRMFPPREVAPDKLLQHRHIRLSHGINRRCHNCHDDADRNLLVLRDGTTIGYGRVVELCAQCHGPTFRDWQRGAHGRTNGNWDRARGRQHRLGCTECHDPHQPRVPAMDPLKPLPGPRALRAAVTDVDLDHAEPVRDPLRRHAAQGHVEVLPGATADDLPVEYFQEDDE